MNERDNDSDVELEEAFKSGKLQGGQIYEASAAPKYFVNDQIGLKETISGLKSLQQVFMNFPESLYCTSLNLPKTLTQDEIDIKEQANVSNLTQKLNKEQLADLVKRENQLAKHDFQREAYFYNLAQSSLHQILPKIKNAGMPTERPGDYFAEMIKSDQHMDKIKRTIVAKQAKTEKLEKIVKARREKRFKKKLAQVDESQRKAAKIAALTKTKLWKKKNAGALGEGIVNDTLDFSKNRKFSGKDKSAHKGQKKLSKKALYKLQRFGQTGFKTAVGSVNTGKHLKRGFQKRNNMKADEMNYITNSNQKFNKNNNKVQFANFQQRRAGKKFDKSRMETKLKGTMSDFNHKKHSRKGGKKRPGKNRRLKLKSIAKNQSN